MADETGIQKEGSMESKMRLKWVLVILAIVIITGAALWASKALECKRIAQERDEALSRYATECAEAVAIAVSVFGNKQINAESWDDLQRYADELVSKKSLAYVAIVDNAGVAVVHTNRSFRDSQFSSSAHAGLVQASAPVMRLTEQSATVHVGMVLQKRQ